MKVLVTGGLGYLGSTLIRDLAKVPEVSSVRILDNLSTSRYSSLFNLPDSVTYEFIEGDIRRVKDLRVATKGVDTVIHLAAITDAPSTFAKQRLTRMVNHLGTRNVVRASVEAGVRRLIYPSTTSVYGPTDGIAKEDCAPEDYKPASPYASFKLAGEKEVLRSHDEDGLESVVLRFGTVYGHGPGIRYHTVVNKFVLQACLGKPLTVWKGALDQYRPYLHINDAMRALIMMISRKGVSGEVYNVLTQNHTLRSVVDTIGKLIPSVKIEWTDNPLLNQLSYYTNDSKIRRLGFKPLGNLEDGVRGMVEALKSIKGIRE